jgi:hypothetical protein
MRGVPLSWYYIYNNKEGAAGVGTRSPSPFRLSYPRKPFRGASRHSLGRECDPETMVYRSPLLARIMARFYLSCQ